MTEPDGSLAHRTGDVSYWWADCGIPEPEDVLDGDVTADGAGSSPPAPTSSRSSLGRAGRGIRRSPGRARRRYGARGVRRVHGNRQALRLLAMYEQLHRAPQRYLGEHPLRLADRGAGLRSTSRSSTTDLSTTSRF